MRMIIIRITQVRMIRIRIRIQALADARGWYTIYQIPHTIYHIQYTGFNYRTLVPVKPERE